MWEKQIDALVGDRVNELYLVMACRQRSLTAREYDQLRREMLSARALGEGQGRIEAERKEAEAGTAMPKGNCVVACAKIFSSAVKSKCTRTIIVSGCRYQARN